jgi:NitT/TauT family transport system permease protein
MSTPKPSATVTRTSGSEVPGWDSSRERSRPHLADLLPVALAAIGFVVVWQLVVWIGDYPAFILPGPALVADRFVRAWVEGTMWPHVTTTLTEVTLGLLVGGIAGLAIGILLARSRLAERLISPYLVAAQATPILALAPLIALWLGTGLSSRVLICALICFFPIAVSTLVGVRSVDGRLLELARALRATRWQTLREIEVPSALPAIFGGLRVGVTLAVVGAIVAEWAGGERGLGVLINLARGSLFDIPLMFATLLTIALLGVTLYLAVVIVERRLVPSAARSSQGADP